MVMPALGAAVTHTRSAARLVRGVVFEIALGGGPSAGRGGTGRVPDLGQVPQRDAGIMPSGLMPVIAVLRGDRLKRDDQVPLSGDPDGQPPGPDPAGRSASVDSAEGEPGPSCLSRRSGRGPAAAFGPCAPVAD